MWLKLSSTSLDLHFIRKTEGFQGNPQNLQMPIMGIQSHLLLFYEKGECTPPKGQGRRLLGDLTHSVRVLLFLPPQSSLSSAALPKVLNKFLKPPFTAIFYYSQPSWKSWQHSLCQLSFLPHSYSSTQSNLTFAYSIKTFWPRSSLPPYHQIQPSQQTFRYAPYRNLLSPLGSLKATVLDFLPLSDWPIPRLFCQIILLYTNPKWRSSPELCAGHLLPLFYALCLGDLIYAHSFHAYKP